MAPASDPTPADLYSRSRLGGWGRDHVPITRVGRSVRRLCAHRYGCSFRGQDHRRSGLGYGARMGVGGCDGLLCLVAVNTNHIHDTRVPSEFYQKHECEFGLM